MRFIYIGEESKRVTLDKIAVDDGSAVLLGAGYLPPINLDDELLGTSNYIKTLCVMSRERKSVIMGGTALGCGKKRFWGTIAADNGKFLGISDMTHSVSGKFDESSALRVFETSLGRLGIVSGEDIYFCEVTRLLRLWECSLFIFAANEPLSHRLCVLAEAQAVMNGISALIFGSNGFRAYGCSSLTRPTKNILNLSPRSSDLLINARRKELYRELVVKMN